MNEEKYDKFIKFHRANPHIFEAIVNQARVFRRRKPEAKIGIALIWNLLRWENALSTTGEVYKLPNDYQPYYARLVMHVCEDLEGIFETRKMFANGGP